jgi:assimilatory nitrate reductase catalytic subunit
VRFDTDPAAVFDELARASAGGRADYSGLSHARLDADEDDGGPGFFWPVPGPTHPGTPRSFLDAFPTPDGRASLVAVDHVGPQEPLRADAPIHLVTGRVLQHYQSGAQTRRVAELNEAVPDAVIELHPVLGLRLGVQDGDRVRLTSARGWVEASARWSDRIRPDTVFMPFHFAGVGSVNRVTNDATDPISGMPEFKVCAVDVAAVTAGSQSAPEEISA